MRVKSYLIKDTFLIFIVSCDETLESLLKVYKSLLGLGDLWGEVLFEGGEEGSLTLTVPHQPSGHLECRVALDPGQSIVIPVMFSGKDICMVAPC